MKETRYKKIPGHEFGMHYILYLYFQTISKFCISFCLDVKPSQATKENEKIMEIKGIEPNAVDNHRQIRNKNGTVSAIENKSHADIDEKSKDRIYIYHTSQ